MSARKGRWLVVVYITRHGQVLPDPQCAPGQASITELGRKQANQLGQRLRNLGFSGQVISSPYRRCLETSSIICATLGTVFAVDARLGERAMDWIDGFQGLRAEEIAALFPLCHAKLDWPWWPTQYESMRAVSTRTQSLLDTLVKEAVGDVLLVGHGASAGAVFECLTAQWCEHHNTALSAVEIAVPANRVILAGDVAHLGIGEVTMNEAVVA